MSPSAQALLFAPSASAAATTGLDSGSVATTAAGLSCLPHALSDTDATATAMAAARIALVSMEQLLLPQLPERSLQQRDDLFGSSVRRFGSWRGLEARERDEFVSRQHARRRAVEIGAIADAREVDRFAGHLQQALGAVESNLALRV